MGYSKYLRMLPALAYLTTIWVLSSSTIRFFSAAQMRLIDKQLHFWGYGFLALTLSYAVYSSFAKRRPFVSWLLVMLFVTAWAALDEYHQSFVPGRQIDFADWKADVGGATLSASVYFIITWFKSVISKRKEAKALCY